MASALADAHIEGQRRLRVITAALVAQAWKNLPGYDEQNVDQFLSAAVPLSLAAQRQSVSLTEAFLARALKRQPLGVDVEKLIGAGVRNGTSPEDVYRRPFVTVWTSLSRGGLWEDAVSFGDSRATSTAAMDVQLSMRGTAQAVQEADDGIYGYQRAADGGACAFCAEIDGAYVKSADAFPLHNHCGCGLEPLTAPHPRAAFLPSGQSVREDAYAIHEHGELGSVLTAPDHAFTSESEIH